MKKQEEKNAVETIEMPDVTGMAIKEAIKLLKENGFEVEVQGIDENDDNINEKNVTEQLPKKGIKINSGSKVTIYTQ